MAVYFADFVNGLDANNGLGPDASHATNKPWKTLAKLLGAAGMASGDTAYLSPAGPFREVVTVAMTSATAETKIIADVANAQGFKTSGGVLVTPGDVVWTAYTTDDLTAPGARPLALSARDFLTFENVVFIGGNTAPSLVQGSATLSTDIRFTRCTFIAGHLGTAINASSLADLPLNWTLDSCIFFTPTTSAMISLTLATSATADYDVNFVLKNCFLIGGSAGNHVVVGASGALAFKGGGVDLVNCTVIGGANVNITNSANISTSIPCTVYNCVCFSQSVALSANTSGQIIEDYNWIAATTPRTNVPTGSNSVSGNPPARAPLFEVGQALLNGRAPRPFGMPTKGSPILGFGNQAGGPTVDLLGFARASGGESVSPAVGAYERGDTAVRETTTVRTGANAIKIVGPGSQDFQVPVDAASTTVSIYGRYDTNHGTSNKPQMKVLNGSECGVADDTDTMTGAVDTWEQLSFTFTPTAAGIVTIRVVSRSAAGNGIAFFDDFARS